MNRQPFLPHSNNHKSTNLRGYLGNLIGNVTEKFITTREMLNFIQYNSFRFTESLPEPLQKEFNDYMAETRNILDRLDIPLTTIYVLNARIIMQDKDKIVNILTQNSGLAMFFNQYGPLIDKLFQHFQTNHELLVSPEAEFTQIAKNPKVKHMNQTKQLLGELLLTETEHLLSLLKYWYPLDGTMRENIRPKKEKKQVTDFLHVLEHHSQYKIKTVLLILDLQANKPNITDNKINNVLLNLRPYCVKHEYPPAQQLYNDLLQKLAEYLSENKMTIESKIFQLCQQKIIYQSYLDALLQLVYVRMPSEDQHNIQFIACNFIINNKNLPSRTKIFTMTSICKYHEDLPRAIQTYSSLLSMANMEGDKAVFLWLLEHGANPCTQLTDGSYPIHFAVSHGSLECVTHIIKHSIETGFNLTDANGYNALHLAIQRFTIDSELFSEIISELLESKHVDINHKNKQGDTPFHLIYRTKNIPLIEEFLEYGANKTIKNLKGLSVEQMANDDNENEILELLNNTYDEYSDEPESIYLTRR